MSKLFVCMLLVCVVHLNMFAQQRTKDQCAQLAVDLGYVKYPFELNSASFLRAKTSVKTSVSYYIFNDTIYNRFAIVSADTRMQPILGYGKGEINLNNMPEGLIELLHSYSNAYDFVQNVPYVNNTEYNVKIQSKTVQISPLIKTAWGQGIPFNNNTPRLGKYDRTASGCIATAMAQIMRYYCYPSSGNGRYSYTTRTHKIYVEEDFSQTIFDWSEMLNSYHGNFTQTQGSAVATLMKSCGVSVGMDYDKSSGAYSSDIPYAMVNNFDYNPNIQYYLKQYFSDEEWVSLIINELINGRPMIYSAVDTKEGGGHAFILDGADGNGLFHLNWGWEGAYDGYFAISALNPDTYKYNSGHSLVCHIQPETTELRENVFYASTFSPNLFEANIDEKLEFILNSCMCYANTTSYERCISQNWDFTLGIYDSEDKLIQIGEIESKAGKSQENVGSFHISIKPNIGILDPESVYYIKPIVSKSGTNNYSAIRTVGGENNHYKLTIKDGKLSINDQLESSFTESGINYRITSKSERSVMTVKGDYHSCVNIPANIIHDGIEYTTTAIDDKAFMQSFDLREVVLPSTILSIGKWCFDGCSSLEKIVCFAQVPPICEFYVTYPFDDVVPTAKLYVPYGSKDAYSLAEGWCNFKNIEELNPYDASVNNAIEEKKSSIVFSINGTKLNGINKNEFSRPLSTGVYIINNKKYLINKNHK